MPASWAKPQSTSGVAQPYPVDSNPIHRPDPINPNPYPYYPSISSTDLSAVSSTPLVSFQPLRPLPAGFPLEPKVSPDHWSALVTSCLSNLDFTSISDYFNQLPSHLFYFQNPLESPGYLTRYAHQARDKLEFPKPGAPVSYCIIACHCLII
ncbi:hypothetical protein CEUSTIGMA_g13883.t1 [Chlamydomonas eustigma]|uniref:Uncharacterized protein n=1 Tax=Chlamydomonas eustigma TaxID=1157962 RepID=A0A250XTU6_9CHLO|nr:hypothetical protein CEUSTIGMA_g13883.t1 [Chlamydomonas eustigma]|eukprot:GAX86474.1 hypothetical protein CEUSTIGMA_g13883.t1 [Chlamydomonas eustigma]